MDSKTVIEWEEEHGVHYATPPQTMLIGQVYAARWGAVLGEVKTRTFSEGNRIVFSAPYDSIANAKKHVELFMRRE